MFVSRSLRCVLTGARTMGDKQLLETTIKESQKTNKVGYYTGDVTPIAEIRNFLKKYENGRVDVDINNETQIATLTLNNPGKRNAVSGKMMVDLEAAVGKLEKWKEGKAVLLHGADGTFCSGGDLDFVKKTGNADDGFKMATYMQHVLTCFENLPLITAAFIDGTGALGGGAELAVSCDFRLMAPDPKTGIGFVHNRMGITPAWGGVARLVKHVGYRKALDAITTAKVYRLDEALRIGLVDGKAATTDDALAWLSARVCADATVVKALKCLAMNAISNGDDVQNVESRLFAPFWGGPVNREALEKNIKHRTE